MRIDWGDDYKSIRASEGWLSEEESTIWLNFLRWASCINAKKFHSEVLGEVRQTTIFCILLKVEFKLSVFRIAEKSPQQEDDN